MFNHELYENVPVIPALRYNETTPTAATQLEIKHNIDTVICHSLDGSALKEALFVIDNIRENKMKIKWFSVNVWTVRYKGRYVCDLRIENGALIIGEISGVLATRVKTVPHSPVTVERFMNALRDSLTAGQKAYAPV